MTAVIYARYSSDNQREESIEGQIRNLHLHFAPLYSRRKIVFLSI